MQPDILDPRALVASTTLRYQLGDTHVVSDVRRPTTHVLPTTADIKALDKAVAKAADRVDVGIAATFFSNAGLIFGAVTTTPWMLIGCLPAVFVGVRSIRRADALEKQHRATRVSVTVESCGRSDLEVPSNVRDAWHRIRSVAESYADDPTTPTQVTALEAGAWVVVEEIAARVADGTGSGPECLALADSLFRAAAQADTYDLLRRNDTHQLDAPQAAALLNSVDLSGHLDMLAPAGTPTHSAGPILTTAPEHSTVS